MVREFGKKSFADVKFNDIPNTVKGAAKGITTHRVEYFNVMALGGEEMMAKAVEGAQEKSKELGIQRPKIIAVTILTSLNFPKLKEIGIEPPKDMTFANEQEFITYAVLKLAALAVNAGVDCLLSSPFEVPEMRAKWSEKEIITPGIRMPWDPPDDQKRTMTPGEAVKNGVSGLVIGRSIRNPQGGRTRKEVIEAIYQDIDSALSVGM
jgi:orotidine-5'-phosphate decarboxylase